MKISSNTLRGQLRRDYNLAKHTTFKIGGAAELFYQPADLTDLKQFLKKISPNKKIFWIGNGSNLLIRDRGMTGVVLAPKMALVEMKLVDEELVKVGAGVHCSALTRYCLQHELAGCEFLAGIPGTIGGALAMNAGAFQNEIWQHVSFVETINRNGEINIRKADDFFIKYRSVKGRNEEWFVAAHLNFKKAEREVIRNRIKELTKERITKQPLAKRTCGSVFRNPPHGSAGQLLESCGLKGRKIGGAMISKKHANFILNIDNASAQDVENLIKEAKRAVSEKFKVELKLEVKIVGD